MKAGHGVDYAHDGALSRTGILPIATMGGLKARGHPVRSTIHMYLAVVSKKLVGGSHGCVSSIRGISTTAGTSGPQPDQGC